MLYHNQIVCLFLCVLQEKEERYLMLFPNVLVMLSASPRMSGFIYQVSRTANLPFVGRQRHVPASYLLLFSPSFREGCR